MRTTWRVGIVGRTLLAVALAGMSDACHSGTAFGGTTHRVLTQAGYDSLPRFQLADGHLVCNADGRSSCPLRSPAANWLGGDRYAMWQPGRPIGIWIGKNAMALDLPNAGQGPNTYTYAVAVGADDGGIVVVDARPTRMLRFDANGTFKTETALHAIAPGAARGFAGGLSVLQWMAPLGPTAPAQFQVLVYKSFTDTAGRTVLTLPLPWLRLKTDNSGIQPVNPIPFFPMIPAYTFADNGDLIWSAAEYLSLTRQSARGDTLWTLQSTIPGVPITAADVLEHRAQLDSASPAHVSDKRLVDSMVLATGRYRAAVAAIVAAPSGRLLVIGNSSLARDSINVTVVESSGQPSGRFTLPRGDRVLLFAGDSLLVHHPFPNAPSQVRWLVIKAAR